MSLSMKWRDALDPFPFIAILRGLTPDEAIPIGEVLFDAGFRIIEVPLNSPKPLVSIEKLAQRFENKAIIGAGTVLTPAQVDAVKAAGGQIIVSPNTNPAVIRHSKTQNLLSAPGCQTISEAFTALDAGADMLKFFPGEAVSPAIFKAMQAVLPNDAVSLVVGGVNADNLAAYRQVGAAGFGTGSSVFKAGDSLDEVHQKAKALSEAWQHIKD